MCGKPPEDLTELSGGESIEWGEAMQIKRRRLATAGGPSTYGDETLMDPEPHPSPAESWH